MGWPREQDFQELLERCTRKASKGLLDELAALAVADDKQVLPAPFTLALAVAARHVRHKAGAPS